MSQIGDSTIQPARYLQEDEAAEATCEEEAELEEAKGWKDARMMVRHRVVERRELRKPALK